MESDSDRPNFLGISDTSRQSFSNNGLSEHRHSIAPPSSYRPSVDIPPPPPSDYYRPSFALTEPRLSIGPPEHKQSIAPPPDYRPSMDIPLPDYSRPSFGGSFLETLPSERRQSVIPPPDYRPSMDIPPPPSYSSSLGGLNSSPTIGKKIVLDENINNQHQQQRRTSGYATSIKKSNHHQPSSQQSSSKQPQHQSTKTTNTHSSSIHRHGFGILNHHHENMTKNKVIEHLENHMGNPYTAHIFEKAGNPFENRKLESLSPEQIAVIVENAIFSMGSLRHASQFRSKKDDVFIVGTAPRCGCMATLKFVDALIHREIGSRPPPSEDIDYTSIVRRSPW